MSTETKICVDLGVTLIKEVMLALGPRPRAQPEPGNGISWLFDKVAAGAVIRLFGITLIF